MEKRSQILYEFGLYPYSGKHGENTYTKWIGYYLLPVKWGIDKRRVYLSAQIRSGYITKEEALDELKKVVSVDMDFKEFVRRTGVTLDEAMNAKEHTYKDFDHYHFRRFKPLLWLLAKFNLVSYQFYKKYSG